MGDGGGDGVKWEAKDCSGDPDRILGYLTPICLSLPSTTVMLCVRDVSPEKGVILSSAPPLASLRVPGSVSCEHLGFGLKVLELVKSDLFWNSESFGASGLVSLSTFRHE